MTREMEETLKKVYGEALEKNGSIHWESVEFGFKACLEHLARLSDDDAAAIENEGFKQCYGLCPEAYDEAKEKFTEGARFGLSLARAREQR
jgi:hypothetical protein